MQDPRIAFLRDLGLTDTQARVYVALATLGRGAARETSERARTPRTQVYAVLDALVAAGLARRDGDQYVAEDLLSFVARRSREIEERRDALVAHRAELEADFAPADVPVDERQIRLVRGPTRPGALLLQWVLDARRSLHATFSAATLADALRHPDLGPALTEKLMTLGDVRVVLHGPASVSRLAAVPPEVIAVTRVAPAENWHVDRIVVDGERLAVRMSLGTSATVDAPMRYVALATSHPLVVADAAGVVAFEWSRAVPALDVLGGATVERAGTEGAS